MRHNILRKHSTKAERVFYEILKENKIPFLFRKKVDGREIDFIIGKYAIEIDGHPQSTKRNKWLSDRGYVPLHYTNDALRNHKEKVKQSILNKWQYLISTVR